MNAPDGWPFESWLDIEMMMASQGPIGGLGRIYKYISEEMIGRFLKYVWPGGSLSLKILYGFTANTRFGARSGAALLDDHYAVALDGGTLPQMLMVVERLAVSLISDRSEKMWLTPRFALPLTQRNGKTDFLFGGKREAPEGVNYGYGDQILIYSLMFVILHEMAHLAGRHREYLADFERSNPSDTRMMEERQLLEHVADAWAQTRGVTLLNLMGLPQEKLAQQLRLWGLAIGMVFLLMEARSAGDNLGGCSPTHPSATQRHFLSKGLAQAQLDAHATELFAGIEEAERAWGRMGWDHNSDPPDSTAFIQRLFELEARLCTKYPANALFVHSGVS